nr:MAG TPA: major tail protein [Caudoviricetes sp.]
MGKFTKIPQNTFEELQMNAGVILTSFDPSTPDAPEDTDIVCATTGGIQVSCVPTYSDMGEDVDNCPVNMMELKHLDSWECTMSFTALGTSPEAIKLALGAADIGSPDTTKVTPRRDLLQTDFQDIWWVGDRADGGMVAVCLKNALSTGGFSLQTTKNGKGQVSVELTGHVSMDAQDTMPMEFYSAGPEEST